MKKLIIVNFVISILIFNQVVLSQTASKICNLGLGDNKPCTFHVHDNNLNLPTFLTDFVVQSEVQIILDCNDNIEKNRCSAVLLNNNINANDNEVLILTARHYLHKNLKL